MIEIITIGDEILIGQIVDTNSAWMATELNKAGFQLSQVTSVHDDAELIKSALDLALTKNNVVLLTGGLGPTKDDLTKQTLAEYFDTKLVFDQSVYDNIEALYHSRPSVLNKLTEGQAMVPENCIIIQNKVGTAPIMWFEKDGKVVVSMPGVPFEMKKVMIDEIVPRLQKKFNRNAIINQTVQVFGLGESTLALKIEEWENALPEYLHLAYLPSFGLVKLRLSGTLENGNQLQKEIIRQFELLDKILGDAIVARNDLPIEKNLGEILQAKKWTISLAESCTGGTIAHKITSIAGSSNYFIGSVTAYQNEIKKSVLHVSEDDLKSYGAVSQQVVEQMAEGVRELMDTDISIAVSGIAGPGGGTDEKPVGTVWIAVATNEKTISRKYQFGNFTRESIIERSSVAALVLAMEVIRAI